MHGHLDLHFDAAVHPWPASGHDGPLSGGDHHRARTAGRVLRSGSGSGSQGRQIGRSLGPMPGHDSRAHGHEDADEGQDDADEAQRQCGAAAVVRTGGPSCADDGRRGGDVHGTSAEATAPQCNGSLTVGVTRLTDPMTSTRMRPLSWVTLTMA